MEAAAKTSDTNLWKRAEALFGKPNFSVLGFSYHVKIMKKIIVAIAGNPNSGKTTIFNMLTGAHQHVANYPGVTVEKKEGVCTHEGHEILDRAYWHILRAETSCNFFWGSNWVHRAFDDLEQAERLIESV